MGRVRFGGLARRVERQMCMTIVVDFAQARRKAWPRSAALHAWCMGVFREREVPHAFYCKPVFFCLCMRCSLEVDPFRCFRSKKISLHMYIVWNSHYCRIPADIDYASKQRGERGLGGMPGFRGGGVLGFPASLCFARATAASCSSSPIVRVRFFVTGLFWRRQLWCCKAVLRGG